MNGVETLLEAVRRKGLADGNLRGLLHVLIGRKITAADGTVVSTGHTWRATADLLKRLRWPPEAVREFALDPETLSPRDRQRFWFAAITAAQVQSPEAAADGDVLAAKLTALGYIVGPAPQSQV